MLFPVYWMVNVSLQPQRRGRPRPGCRSPRASTATRRRCSDRAGTWSTSLVIALGSVVFSLLIAAPGRVRAGALRVRGAGVVLFAILISQMIPGIVVANALYTAYNDLGLLNSIPGLILADSTHGIPFAILIMRAFMTTFPPSVIEAARVDGAGHAPRVRLHRAAAEPERAHHRRAVHVPVRLGRLPLRPHPDHHRGRAPRDARPLHVHRRAT